MASQDFSFLTLRNLAAYDTNGAPITDNYVLTVSTFGRQKWTNDLILNNIKENTTTYSDGSVSISSTPDIVYPISDFNLPIFNLIDVPTHTWISVAISTSGQYQTAISDSIWYSMNYGVIWTKSDSPTLTWTSIAVSTSGQYQIAISNDIWYSTNYGVNWNRYNVPYNYGQSGVAISGSGQYQTVVSNGILYSTNYGVTWTEVTFIPITLWTGIAMSTSGQYQTVVSNNMIMYSIDYGVKWIEIQMAGSWTSVKMSATGQYQTIVSDKIMYSTNYGVTWNTTPYADSWKSVAMSASGQYQFAVSNDIWYSYNYGVSWASIYSFQNGRGIAMSSSGQYITAVNDNIYISIIPYETIATNTLNVSTINAKIINISTLNIAAINDTPYGFARGVSPSTIIVTNSTLFTVPLYISSITFTLLGAGGGGNDTNSGGGGGYARIQITNPPSSVFALYPGTSKGASTLGGGMSMVFATNSTTYTCIAVAGGGAGAGGVWDGAGGGVSSEAVYGGFAGANGLGGHGGFSASNGSDFSTIGDPAGNPPVFYNTSFTTITVLGGGGAGTSNISGSGGDGYGGGGGGGYTISGYASGGGGGNYCFASTNYSSTIINGSTLIAGSTIGTYGYGGTAGLAGNNGIIIIDILNYATASIYDFVPSTTQSLGTYLDPWYNVYANNILGSTITTSTITTTALNVSTVNGYPYGFSGRSLTTLTYINSTLFTVPNSVSTITFTMLGAGGGAGGGSTGGNGSYVKLQISNPTANSQFALYPGISKGALYLGGGMSMVFSTNNTTYTCMAIAAGGGGGSIFYGNGGSGGGNSIGSGLAGLNGVGGDGATAFGSYTAGSTGSSFSTIGNPPIFLNTSFTTISVKGTGGAGGGGDGYGGSGGDGYGGGGGGAGDGGGGGDSGGGGGGNYCYANGTTYFSTIINAGSTIGTYGQGGTVTHFGNSGVIIIDIVYYATTSLYDLIPSSIQSLGSPLYPWTNLYTSTISTSTLNASIVNFSTMVGNEIIMSTLNASTINFSTMVGNEIITSTLNASTINFSTMSGNEIITSTLNANSINFSMMSGNEIITSTLNANSINFSTMSGNEIIMSTINTSTINFSTMVGNEIITSTLNANTINNYPYGFSGISIFSSSIITNSTLFTVPQNVSRITFTMLGAGGGGSVNNQNSGKGGGGAYVTLQINNPTANSQFALYPGTSKNGLYLGGEMSMVFSTSGTTYTCMAVAGGGAGSSAASGGGGGGGVGGANNPTLQLLYAGKPGLNGDGGLGGLGGNTGSSFSTIGNPPIFLNTSFTTISVNGIGGYGNGSSGGGGIGYDGGHGGDGYGGGGAGSNFSGGGGGGNYCFANGTNYFSTIINGFTINAGSTIGTYGQGGDFFNFGNPGVIIIDIVYYATTSIYDLFPTSIQSLGSPLYPWSNIYGNNLIGSTITTTALNVTTVNGYPYGSGTGPTGPDGTGSTGDTGQTGATGPGSNYFTETGPTGFSTNDISIAANTGPTGTVQAGTGAVFSIYNTSQNGDIGITNNLLVAGATTYPDGSVAISNTPALVYSNNITFTASSQSELNGLSWISVAMSSSGQYQTAVIVGGNIYFSTNYGISWTPCAQNFNDVWYFIAMSVSGQYQTAGITGAGNIYFSTNYGVSWTPCSQNFNLGWNSGTMSASGQYQTAVVSGGNIYFSTNYGVSWTPCVQNFTLNWQCVAMSASGQYQTALIVLDNIYFSTNYGVSWTPCVQNFTLNWRSVAMSASGQYQTAVIYDGNIYYSTNYGVSWTPCAQNFMLIWQMVAMSASGQYQTATCNNSIYYSTDYGKTWESLNSITTDWRRIAMSSSGQYITAISNTIYTANIPLPATSYLTNTNLVIGNVRQNPGATGSIVLNASLTTMTGFSGSQCYIKPIRNAGTNGGSNILSYNPTTSEVTYNSAISALNVSTVNGYAYGFSSGLPGVMTSNSTITNSTLFTVPQNVSKIEFTMLGAGGCFGIKKPVTNVSGGGGAYVKLQINDPTPNSIFALYPGTSKNASTLGGGMSMVFSTSGTTYTCMAIAGGGGGAGYGYYGQGGGAEDPDPEFPKAGVNGVGGAAGNFGPFPGLSTVNGTAGTNFSNSTILPNPPVFENTSFTTISVNGTGGAGANGADINISNLLGGSGGDGYGGGGGGGAGGVTIQQPTYNISIGGAGGGNYCFANGTTYFSTIINGNVPFFGYAGSTIVVNNVLYGKGGTYTNIFGNPGVIIVDITYYATTSIYDLLPSSIQNLGTSLYPWSNIYGNNFIGSTITTTALNVSTVNGYPYGPVSNYFTQTGPTGFSTNPRSIAATTGPTGTVQAGTGAVFSIYNGLTGSEAINGDIGITNNLLVAGATIYPDGSAAISNTPPLVYSNNITFTASSQTELNGPSWISVAMSASGQYQTACIQSGYIWYSTNYGITWIQSNSGPANWLCVDMSSSGQYQTACIQSGLIYYSTNYGINWLESNSISTIWYSVAMSSSGQYQSAVAYTASTFTCSMWYSTNYGINWIQSSSVNDCWNSIAMSSSGQYQSAIVYNPTNGFIYYSTNYGINWTRSNSPAAKWISVAMSSSGQYQSSCISNGSIWYSTDYGINWTVSNAIGGVYWSSIAMSSSGQYQTACIDNGSIYYSTNYGKTWIQSNSPNAYYYSIAMSSSGQYITAVVSGGTIYTANIPLPATSYLTNTNLVIGNVRQNPGATGSIVLNASLTTMTGFSGSQCYIKPIRNAGTNGGSNNILTYNPTTSEVTYSAIINFTQTGPTGFSTNPRSIAATTGPTGAVQAGTGAVFSIYNGLTGSQAINGDIGITNNLLVAGATIYPDGSAAISNTPPLVYSNNITFTPSSQSGLNGFIWRSNAMSSSGQYQTACIQGVSGLIWYSTDYGITWTQSNSIPANWNSVAMSSSGQYQSAVHFSGGIWYSINYGVTWTQSNSINADWISIRMSSSGQYQSACILASSTKIYYSTNYGIDWTVSNSPTAGLWTSIAMSSSGQYQSACVLNDFIYYSTDYGINWTKINATSSAAWYSIAMSSSGQYQTASTNGVSIHYSTNYGIDWTVSNSPINNNWVSVAMSSSGQYQSACTQTTFIYYSTDYGKTWTSLNINIGWNSVAMSSSGQYITAISNTIYTANIPIPATSYLTNTNLVIGNVRQNPAATQSIVLNASLTTLTGFSGSQCYIKPIRNAGTNGASNILSYNSTTSEVTYNSAIINWTQTGPTGFSTNPRSIAATTGPTGAVQAGTGAVFSVYNGLTGSQAINGDIGVTNNLLVAGATIYPDGSAAISNMPPLVYSNNIIITPSSQSELNGLGWFSVAMSASGQYQSAVVYNGSIWYSTNYGINWTQSSSGTASWLSIAVSSSGQYQSSIIQATATTGSIWYSTNYGINWTQSSAVSAGWNAVAMSSSGQYQTAVIYDGLIWYSTNYGISWSLSTALSSRWISVAISSSGQYQTAVATDTEPSNSSNSAIWYSTNYGINWTRSNSGSARWNICAISASGQYQTAVVYGGFIYYSTNYGVTWTQSSSSSVLWGTLAVSSSGQYQIASISSGSIWYSTNYGKIWTSLNSVTPNWKSIQMSSSGQYITAVAYTSNIYTANIPLPATSYLTNTNLVIGNVRQNPAATQSIVLNASLTTMTGFNGSACYIKPIRNINATSTLHYNPTTSEVTYGIKTFVIDHPVNTSKYLVHACIEGPEVGVYYRGTSEIETGKIEKIITLPEYVESFATDFTVTVTPIYNGTLRTLNSSKITNNFFTVYGSEGEFDWSVFGKRADINVEPYKNEVTIKGDGPYKYIE